MGIQVVEGEETEDGEAPVAKAEKTEEAEDEEEPTGNVDEASLGRTDDPVRMYLREMGSVELLSREGEIAIAKRIEAGRDMMIGGLCESPLTFKAIIAWHDAAQGRPDAAARHHRPGGDRRAPARPRRTAAWRRTRAAERRRDERRRGARGAGRPRRRRGGRGPGHVAVGARGEAEARGAGDLRGDRGRCTRSCTRCSTGGWRP